MFVQYFLFEIESLLEGRKIERIVLLRFDVVAIKVSVL